MEQFLKVVCQKRLRRHSWRSFRSSLRKGFKYILRTNFSCKILAYAIPGKQGSLRRGERLINWVWYDVSLRSFISESQNYPDRKEVMTDTNGETHLWTNQHVPKELIEKQKAHAKKILPPQFAELVELTEKPFIQAITDVYSRRSVFYDGRLILVGDALAGFRPHTAASTSQAAFHALLLNQYLRSDEIDWDGFERRVLEYAENGVQHGIQMGNRSQFGKHPMDPKNKK